LKKTRETILELSKALEGILFLLADRKTYEGGRVAKNGSGQSKKAPGANPSQSNI
jgi:hypothetical protein